VHGTSRSLETCQDSSTCQLNLSKRVVVLWMPGILWLKHTRHPGSTADLARLCRSVQASPCLGGTSRSDISISPPSASSHDRDTALHESSAPRSCLSVSPFSQSSVLRQGGQGRGSVCPSSLWRLLLYHIEPSRLHREPRPVVGICSTVYTGLGIGSQPSQQAV
jgi:hypothetical protein